MNTVESLKQVLELTEYMSSSRLLSVVPNLMAIQILAEFGGGGGKDIFPYWKLLEERAGTVLHWRYVR